MAQDVALVTLQVLVQQAAGLAEDLIGVARDLSQLGAPGALGRPAPPVAPERLAEGVRQLAAARQALMTVQVAAPAARAAEEAGLAGMIQQAAPGSVSDEQARRVVDRLSVLGLQAEPVRDLRACYRLALRVGANPQTKELVMNRAPMMALAQLGPKFPEVVGWLQAHVDEFGWLRARGGQAEPATIKELVQRLQMILLRWQPEHIERAAQGPATPKMADALGFEPPPQIVEAAGVLQRAAGARCLGPDAFRQADAVAGGFWEVLARALGAGAAQVRAASAEELLAALGGAPLPASQVPAAADLVTGQSVSVGRAVGRVRIMYGPMEVPALEMGDVLVTAASTPDKMGTESTFPTREGAPAGMERVAAIVADEGGLLSHAATISRELGIPCVVGTETGTRALKDGQMVEVDATKEQGRVIVLDL